MGRKITRHRNEDLPACSEGAFGPELADSFNPACDLQRYLPNAAGSVLNRYE
jgi:hypothetical protein